MVIKLEVRIERQIEKIKRDLVVLGDLRPGSLSTQYNVCGSPGCRCKASPPEKHEHYQVSFTRKGKSSSKFVKKKDLTAIRKQLKNYERLNPAQQRGGLFPARPPPAACPAAWPRRMGRRGRRGRRRARPARWPVPARPPPAACPAALGTAYGSSRATWRRPA